MARGELEVARGVKCFSYRRVTTGFCCVNLILALFVLRSLNSSSSVSSESSTDVRFRDEQINRVEESIRIRQEFEPVELVRLVKKLKKELKLRKKGSNLSKPVKLNLAFEILSRLKGMDNLTEWRGALESWRVEKLEEIKRWSLADTSTNLSIPLKEAKKLKKALETDWLKLLESIGFWMPSDVTHTVVDDKPDNVELEEEIIPGPTIPPECHAELHTDYAGAAVRWGLTHHKESAAECCQACLDLAKNSKPGDMKCNIWVYCPSEFGCYSPDKYEHKHQECWLKQDEKPRLNFKDSYSDAYRSSHPNAPLVVPWMAGVITS